MTKYTEFAFKQWASSPKTTHPLDMERFYRFVKTAHRYRNKKYLNEKYFYQEIKKYSEENKITKEEMHMYYIKLVELLKYDEYYPYSIYDKYAIEKINRKSGNN